MKPVVALFQLALFTAVASSTPTDDSKKQEKATAARIVGPETCASCHVQEAAKWKTTHHHSGFRTLNRSQRAAQILGKVGLTSMKKATACRQCHYTSIIKRRRIRPAWGVSCESCHMPATDWVHIHHKEGGRRENDMLTWGAGKQESASSRGRRLAAARDAGMIHSLMLYEIANRCYGCHTVPDEKLVNVGGHADGSRFNLVEAFDRIRHDFVSAEETAGPATRPGGQDHAGPADVVVVTVDLALSLEKLSTVEQAGGRYHQAAIARAAAARSRLESHVAGADEPDLAALLESLPEDLETPSAVLSDTARKLRELGQQIVKKHGGLKLGRD